MPFCSNCGKEYSIGEKFCSSCGHQLQIITQKDSGVVAAATKGEGTTEIGITKQPIDPTSRLSGLGLEKYLLPEERILYATQDQIWSGKKKRHAFVTNRRLILYHREGVLLGLIRNERLDEIDLRTIRRASLLEKGLITKKIVLNLDEMVIEGDRGDIINIYNTVQKIRGSQ